MYSVVLPENSTFCKTVEKNVEFDNGNVYTKKGKKWEVKRYTKSFIIDDEIYCSKVALKKQTYIEREKKGMKVSFTKAFNVTFYEVRVHNSYGTDSTFGKCASIEAAKEYLKIVEKIYNDAYIEKGVL